MTKSNFIQKPAFRCTLPIVRIIPLPHTMLHGNSIKILTGRSFLLRIASFIDPFSQGNSHPELAAAVAER
jgi:hypothetical protein